MKNYLLVCMILCSNSVYSQKIAPGVPPQHYENQQHYQPQQHHPQQQQHHPPQYQQQQYHQPQQQQYQQPSQPPHFEHHQQQVPIQAAPGHQNVHHGHGQPHHQQRVLNTGNLEHEKEHIAEHLDIPLDTKDMTPEQLQFHYFQMHDADNNNMLDGCELIKSLIHWHEQGSKGGGNHIEERIFKDEELTTLIDPILNMDDMNRDGYIDYPEFIQAQRKAAAAGSPPKH